MLNIISRSIVSKNASGPKKVVENLIKGLEQINYPYIINGQLDACSRVWIHDDIDALMQITKIENIHVIVGPNLYITPKQIPKYLNLSKIVYLHPSPWVIGLWKQSGFNRTKLEAWPTGIDTDIFLPSKMEKGYILIYFKERFPEELEYVKNILRTLNLEYKIILYGNYKESDYRNFLKQAKYVIWIGRQESQGIALQEALSTNTPILVWDVKNLGHWQSTPKNEAVFSEKEKVYSEATSAYYFDERCGIICKNKEELKDAIQKMELEYKKFSPREYIVENLSIKKQALAFINLYHTHFDLSFAEGSQEKVLYAGKWKNGKLYFKIYQTIKDNVRNLIK